MKSSRHQLSSQTPTLNSDTGLENSSNTIMPQQKAPETHKKSPEPTPTAPSGSSRPKETANSKQSPTANRSQTNSRSTGALEWVMFYSTPGRANSTAT